MLVGPYTGRKVCEAKPIIKEEMIAAGTAMLYSEPEKPVRSAATSGGKHASNARREANVHVQSNKRSIDQSINNSHGVHKSANNQSANQS